LLTQVASSPQLDMWAVQYDTQSASVSNVGQSFACGVHHWTSAPAFQPAPRTITNVAAASSVRIEDLLAASSRPTPDRL
jgi:hypothetical protein